MKKNMIRMAVLAMILTMAASCVEPLMEKPTVATKTTSFRAILEGSGPQTKTVLGEKNGEGYYPVYWSEGDSIKIVTNQYETSDGQGTIMALTSGAGTNEAVFTGEIPEQTEDFVFYYAIYPYHVSASIGAAYGNGEESIDNGWGWCVGRSIEIELPSVQKYAPHSFGKNYNPALAVTADQTLRFKNICGLLQLNLTGDVKVSKITIRDAAATNLWGVATAEYAWQPGTTNMTFSVGVSNPYYSSNGYHPYPSIQPNPDELTLICDNPVQLTEEATDFYFAIPESTWNPSSADEVSVPLSKGFILTIYDENGKEVYCQVTKKDNSIRRSMVREMPAIDVRRKELTDLSANGGANCYMVAPGGTYKFYAGYRGSSTYPVPAAAEAVVLWETRNSETLSPDIRGILYDGVYNPDTGYITFKTTETTGNALIALRDDEDNILWSWHIWVTNYNPDASGATSRINGTYELMNWDLGAVAADGKGLKYQWGRKDPFTGDFKTAPSSPFNTVGETPNAVQYAIEHPTTILGGGGDWASAPGHIPSHFLWGKQKTMYDPCPPGWQVMDFDVFQSINHRVSGEHLWNADDIPWGGGGFMFYDSEPDLWFPGGGVSGYWTNRHTQVVGAFSVMGDDFFAAYSDDQLPVRCQRSSTVQELRPVIDLSANGTANCYIVEPDKSYKFKATVKGNSNESTGAIAAIEYGFATENNETSVGSPNFGEGSVVSDMYLKDGYVYFSTSMDSRHGNTTIVVKDIHGKALWSWHIWCPEVNPQTNTYTFDGGDGVSYEMMPLNLGALNNTPGTSESLGLMYQWGRKDPFLCARAWDSNAQAEFWGTNESVDASAETSTLQYAISHPTSFIEGSTNWLATALNGLWGPVKTIYDPCPPGWKVPSRPVWSSAHATVAEYDPVSKGLTMDGKWYPAAGYRYSESFNHHNVGLEGHYWYATDHDDGTAHAFYFYYESSTTTDIDLNGHTDKKAQANSVRCVRE